MKANREVAQRQPEGGGHPLAWLVKGAQFLRRSALNPWNKPQSTRILWRSHSTAYFEPVTVPAPPRNDKLVITLHFELKGRGAVGFSFYINGVIRAQTGVCD